MVTALFNTGVTYSCISFPLYSQISDKAQVVEMQLWVGQVDGTNLCPKGIVKVTLEINEKQFEHTFIMYQNLTQPLLFGMDFAQNYRIGIDWNHNSVSYVRHQDRKLISAWPNSSISDQNFMTRETSHVTGASVTLITDGLGIRLKTPAVVIIPPHNIAMTLLEPPFRALHCKNVNTELFTVIGNQLSSIEQPYVLIFHTLHKFDTRYPKQWVAIAVIVGNEDIILNKGMALCFVQETDLITKTTQIKEVDTVNTVDNEDMKDTKRERLKNCLQEISLESNWKMPWKY